MKTTAVLRPAASDPRIPLGEAEGRLNLRYVEEKSQRKVDHWFTQHQDECSELMPLQQLMRCNVEEWGEDRFASSCLREVVAASRQLEMTWPLLYKVAALVKEQGYFTRSIGYGAGQTQLAGCDSFEAWFRRYVHPNFGVFTRMEEEFKLAATTNAPLPALNLADLEPKEKEKVVSVTQGYGAAVEVQPSPGQGARTDLQHPDNIRKSGDSYGTSGVDTYRRIQKLARGGNAQAAALLDQIDRKETTPHAAYIALGLRRPQITVQLEPELHDQLKAWTEATGDTTRDVVESALEIFFRRMANLNVEAQEVPEPEPEPEPSPAIDPPSATEPEPRPEPARQDQPPQPAGEQSGERPQLGDLISGAQVGRLLGKSLAHASNAIKRAQEKGKPIATIQQDGWELVRVLAEEDKRWRVIKVPA